MESKFQNRLVSIVVLFILGIIVLYILLDNKKEHYEDKFSTIPPAPKMSSNNKTESLLSLNQSLPSQPLEGS
ncbi:MAG: hypothetical protein ACFC03_01630 [Candidatus Malihini olakiniferum]